MAATVPTDSRGDQTREALIASALPIFARNGFHAVSTRDIAQAAGINQALIGYHFRNKEGLYLAVFEHITAQIRGRIGPLADAIEAALDAGPTPAHASRRATIYLPHLLRLTDGMAELLSQERSTPWAQLILREQQSPTAAFSVLYDGFMGRVLNLLTRLVMRIRASDDEPAARLTVVTIFGQVMVFRAARAGVLRQMGWSRITDTELAAIQQQVRANVTAMLTAKELP